MEKILYLIAMKRSKKFLIENFSKEWFSKFRKISDENYRDILPQVPKIGKSIFSTNYQFGPIYIAWYKAFQAMDVEQEQIDGYIWTMNERLMSVIPKSLLHSVGKSYLGSFRKKAANHMKRQETTGVHPYDWQIHYRDVNENCFEIDITSCGLKKLAEAFDAEGMLPGICRMDYQLSNMMGNGFERTKTLGDGDDCCNCRYFIVGTCEWAPEKGFVERK